MFYQINNLKIQTQNDLFGCYYHIYGATRAFVVNKTFIKTVDGCVGAYRQQKKGCSERSDFPQRSCCKQKLSEIL